MIENALGSGEGDVRESLLDDRGDLGVIDERDAACETPDHCIDVVVG